jgi:alpha,alpha-trehalase
MPRYYFHNGREQIYSPPDIIRYIKYKSGSPRFKVHYDPKLEYAKEKTVTEERRDFIKSFTTTGPYDSLYLYTSFEKQLVMNREEIVLEKDEFFLISYNQKLMKQNVERAYLKLQRTKVYWLNWTEETHRFTSYNKEIVRSALVLKLLMYEKTGAVLAAATTSLPETIGEIRNWDYRFCWLRDASMVIKIMTKIGHWKSAEHFLNFIIEVVSDKDEKIQIMYGINKEKNLKEHILSHLAGTPTVRLSVLEMQPISRNSTIFMAF